MKTRPSLIFLVAIAAASASVSAVFAQSTTFTYQGRLVADGIAAEGPHDFEFRLFTAAAGGSQVGSVLARDEVAVTGGLFAVSLDFGGVFDGSPRFLAISVRPGVSAGAHTTLSPRQPVTATPYAIQSASATSATAVSGAVAAAQLTGTISPANIGPATITGDLLAAGAVGAGQLAAGAVSPDKLDPTLGVWERAGDDVFRLTGNVGIGTATPGSRLHVAGDVKADGALSVATAVAAGNVSAGGQVAATGNVTAGGNVNIGMFAVAKLSTVSVNNGDQLAPVTGYVRFSPRLVAATLDATTAIVDGPAVGALLILEGNGVLTVTVPDGANTQLGAARALGEADTLTLIWNGEDWVEIAFTNN